MLPVQRDEIIDYQTYNDRRSNIRPDVLQTKRIRRVMIGEALTLLFENHETIWYQIQEMMRAEKIVREVDILHEINTYNELLGGQGELGVCLLIGISDPDERAKKLADWVGLLETLYLELADGTRIPATWDERQVETERISSVQYLKFHVNGQTPVAAGCDFSDPVVRHRVVISADVQAALTADLATDAEPS